jgi:hypothetical protein
VIAIAIVVTVARVVTATIAATQFAAVKCVSHVASVAHASFAAKPGDLVARTVSSRTPAIVPAKELARRTLPFTCVAAKQRLRLPPLAIRRTQAVECVSIAHGEARFAPAPFAP